MIWSIALKIFTLQNRFLISSVKNFTVLGAFALTLNGNLLRSFVNQMLILQISVTGPSKSRPEIAGSLTFEIVNRDWSWEILNRVGKLYGNIQRYISCYKYFTNLTVWQGASAVYVLKKQQVNIGEVRSLTVGSRWMLRSIKFSHFKFLGQTYHEK